MGFGLIVTSAFITAVAFVGIVAYDLMWASDVQ